MSLNPLREIRYRHGLAMDHLRAEISFSAGDWVGTVSSSQLAIENFAKAVIATMEVTTWGHDSSNRRKRLLKLIADANVILRASRQPMQMARRCFHKGLPKL